MALRIRLARKGAKKNPFYRIVVQDAEEARDGRFVEIIGTYDPDLEDKKVVLKEDRYKYWYEKGARPTRTVYELVKKQSA